MATVSERLASTSRQLHEKDLRLTQLNTEQENLQHRFKVEVANHKIDLAKIQREHLEQQEKLRLENQGKPFVVSSISLFHCHREI